MLALKSLGISIHCHQFMFNSPQRCEVSHWNPSNLRRSPERWRSFRPSDLFQKTLQRVCIPNNSDITVYYFYCIVLIHYAGISWGIDVYKISKYDWYIILPLVAQQLLPCWAVFKTIPAVCSPAFVHQQSGRQNRKLLIRNIWGPSSQPTKSAMENNSPYVSCLKTDMRTYRYPTRMPPSPESKALLEDD